MGGKDAIRRLKGIRSEFDMPHAMEGNHSTEEENGRMMSPIRQSLSARGGAGDRFGDYVWVDCANLPCVSGRNQFSPTDLFKKF